MPPSGVPSTAQRPQLKNEGREQDLAVQVERGRVRFDVSGIYQGPPID